jgi:hypothetical protein
VKILYAGHIRAGHASLYILMALQRLGHTVVGFHSLDYGVRNRLLRPLVYRLAIGPNVQRYNRDLRELFDRERPDLFWADKQLMAWPRTLEHFRARSALSVSYMIDNAFGPRRDPGWRLYKKCIPHYDLHVTQRDVSVGHYLKRGARDVVKVQTAYEPTIHFPSPTPISDAERDRGVSFVGTPYDDRAAIMIWLAEQGVPMVISGNVRQWARALGPKWQARLYSGGEYYEKDYREAIWRSKINLSFVTKSNQDEYAHKSFEIAGCGGFLMAERCEGHSMRFKEDEEAVFFSDREELLAKIRRYLPDEAARTRIAAAGHERAVRSGYDNDTQMGLVIERLRAIAAKKGLNAPE